VTVQYDSSWDSDDDEGDAFDRKCEEWRRRNWMAWLSEKTNPNYWSVREYVVWAANH
jgi:hypothetical protein